jgi:ankyrin repeat protein
MKQTTNDSRRVTFPSMKNGDAALVSEPLRRGANPNVKDERDQIPLHIAAAEGHTEIVKLLLEHGAEVNTQDKDG